MLIVFEANIRFEQQGEKKDGDDDNDDDDDDELSSSSTGSLATAPAKEVVGDSSKSVRCSER